MPRSELSRPHGIAALGLTAALFLTACSGEAPETEQANSAETPTLPPAKEEDGPAENSAGDEGQPALEQGPPPVSAGEEHPEGTEVVTEEAFSLAVPTGWDSVGASGPQGEFHYTDPTVQTRGVAVLLSDQPGDRVAAALPVAEQDLTATGLDPRVHRLDWPGAEAAGLVVHDDPEAAPPAVVRTYHLFLDAPDGTAVWVLAYDDVETVEDSPVMAMLASFRLAG